MDSRILARAAGAAGMWLVLAGAAAGQTAPDAAGGAEAPPPAAEGTQGLCGIVEEGARLLADNRMAPADGEMKAALLEAMIRASDPSVVFLDDTELAARDQQLAAREWNTGLTLVAVPDNLPKVAAVQAGSPAATAGILPGELLEKVGGRDVLTGAALKFVRSQLAEGAAAALELGVRAVDGKSRTVTVERVHRGDVSLTDVEELPAGMGYLRAAGIFPGAGAEIAAALEKWQAAGLFGAILDLRGADGAAETEIAALAEALVTTGHGALYTVSSRDGSDTRAVGLAAGGDHHKIRMPLMVLVDEETSGASELLAAVLAGSVQGAMIIGRETAGDPLIREPIRLSTGRHALLAKRQIAVADGTVYDGSGGVVPDVAITAAALDETVYEPDAPVLRKGKTLSDEEKEDKALRDRTRNDTYLRRATDVLLGLKALGYGKS